MSAFPPSCTTSAPGSFDSAPLRGALAQDDGSVVRSKGGSPVSGTGAALIVGNVVMIGVSGAEFGVRCVWTGYDINTGKRLYRAYSMGPDDENRGVHGCSQNGAVAGEQDGGRINDDLIVERRGFFEDSPPALAAQ